MSFNRSSTSSLVQFKRIEFCVISKPEAATPPALAALPGANNTLASKNCLIASKVQGILAASVTQITPLAINFLASSSFNSF